MATACSRARTAPGTGAQINIGLTDTRVYALAIDPATPATLYAGTGGGVFKSTNGGGEWRAFNTGLTNISVYALAIDPETPTILYAGTLGPRRVCYSAEWSGNTGPICR